MKVTIFHNPKCSTSRGTLGLIREAGIEPEIIEYLKAPPSADRLAGLARRAGLKARDMIRRKEPLYAELGLDDPDLTDKALFEAMARNPVLIERPVVETARGVRLCRPKETVLDIL
jgi:arsenate reductase